MIGYDLKDPFEYGIHSETRWFPEKWKYDDIGGASEAHQKYDDRMVGTTLKNKAVDFISENKSEPFFLYFAPHNHGILEPFHWKRLSPDNSVTARFFSLI